MNRKDELTAQIAAHRTTILLLNGQIAQMETELAQMETELAQIEADAPKPFILREIQPVTETVHYEAPAEEAPTVEDKLINELNAVLSTEVHVRMGIGRTRNGHGGAKAAQTRKINKIFRDYTAEQIKAGLAAAKVNNVNSIFHYANDDRGNARAAEKHIAYRLGL